MGVIGHILQEKEPWQQKSCTFSGESERKDLERKHRVLGDTPLMYYTVTLSA